MKKIEKLTPAQEAYLPVFRKEYFDAATSPRRVNRAELEKAIEEVYAIINKPKPLLVILRSPREAMMAISFMKAIASKNVGGQLWDQLRDQLRGQLGDQLWDQLRGQLGDQLWDQLGGQLWGQLWDQLRGQLWGQLGDQLRDQLGDQLWDQLGGQLRGQLWGQLGDQLRDQLGDQLWDQLGGQLWGQLWDQLWDQLRGQLMGQLWDEKFYDINYLLGSQDLYWVAWAKFGEQIGVKYTEEQTRRLNLMRRIGFQCEWWWPYEGICFVSEKPTEIHWEDNRLHNANGPSVLYEDGFLLYTWRGTSVPEVWIKDKSLTAKEALKWENMEQRRAACEILGWNNILKELEAVSVDRDEDPQIGELLEVNIPDIGKEKFLRVLCGTGREFAIPVPPDTKTALEANAWTYDIPVNLFNPELRT